MFKLNTVVLSGCWRFSQVTYYLLLTRTFALMNAPVFHPMTYAFLL